MVISNTTLRTLVSCMIIWWFITELC